MDLGEFGDNVSSDVLIGGVLLVCLRLSLKVGLFKIVKQIVDSLNGII